MDDRTIVALRLRNQQLTGQSAQSPVDVVARLGAMQAQDYAGVLWSVALRMAAGSADATEAGVEAALADGRIVRSWPMRRTYHLVVAEDLRWMLALLAPRVLDAAARSRAFLEIEDGELDRARAVVMATLADGEPRARAALLVALEEAGIKTNGQRGIHMLVNMAQSAQICMGPRVGKEYTFVALDAWVPVSPALDRDEALGKLAQRYFCGHGPATIADLVRWAYMTTADARVGVAVAGKSLVALKAGATKFFMDAEAADAGAPTEAPTLLMPGFDEILLGYSDRSAALDPAQEALWCPGGNGMFKPFLMANGRVVGLWSRKLKKKSVDITVEPFAPLEADVQRAVAEQAERYGRFLGLKAAVPS